MLSFKEYCEYKESILTSSDRYPSDERPIAAWDFDQTITTAVMTANGRHATMEPRPDIIQRMNDLASQGWRNIIVTARGVRENQLPTDKDHPLGSMNIYKAVRLWRLPVASRDIHLLGGVSLGSGSQPKGLLLKRLGVKKFFDDSPKNIASARSAGIDAELVSPQFTKTPVPGQGVINADANAALSASGR
jgi:hypothetical protein